MTPAQRDRAHPTQVRHAIDKCRPDRRLAVRNRLCLCQLIDLMAEWSCGRAGLMNPPETINAKARTGTGDGPAESIAFTLVYLARGMRLKNLPLCPTRVRMGEGMMLAEWDVLNPITDEQADRLHEIDVILSGEMKHADFDTLMAGPFAQPAGSYQPEVMIDALDEWLA